MKLLILWVVLTTINGIGLFIGLLTEELPYIIINFIGTLCGVSLTMDRWEEINRA